MNEQLIQVLTGLGLNKKEAATYLACIEKGTSVVSEIAHEAKINRVSAYDILDKLKAKGLVSFFTKKKTKYFTATDPEIVLSEYEKRTNELRLSLPKFKKLTGQSAHPRVRYFEGIEGIKAIYADTLSAKTEILNYSNSEEIRKNWPNYRNEYIKARIKKRIALRGICPDDNAGQIVQELDKKSHREMRLIPEKQFDFTNEINIYDDKVAIVSFKDELIGMIIESPEIANSQRAIFEMCWQFAKKFQNKIRKHKNLKSEEIRTKMLEPLNEEELKSGEESPKKDKTLPSLF